MSKPINSNKIGVLLVLFLIIIGVSVIIYNRVNKDESNKRKKEKIVINGDNNFEVRLIKEVNKGENGNYLISPYSIRVALNMLAEGANNETEEEIVNVVGNNTNRIIPIKNRINDAYGLFIRNKYQSVTEKDFINNIRNGYNGEVLFDEFKTPDVINNWVKKQTYDMIPKLLDRIGDDFVLGMANAIAIDVEWASQFECDLTHKDSFNKIDKTTKDVSMMVNTFKYGAEYFIEDDYKGVVLPYVPYDKDGNKDYENGEQLEFVGIIPNGDINSFINDMDDSFLSDFSNDVKEASRKERLQLFLPVFSYEYSINGLGEVLNTLGIKKAFSSEEADFTKIITEEQRKKNNIDNIYVNQALHKTYIELNEAGTKAAAVTYFGMYESAVFDMEKPKIIEMKFDKPFMYMIRDRKNKEILFFGVVYEPNAYKERTCE